LCSGCSPAVAATRWIIVSFEAALGARRRRQTGDDGDRSGSSPPKMPLVTMNTVWSNLTRSTNMPIDPIET